MANPISSSSFYQRSSTPKLGPRVPRLKRQATRNLLITVEKPISPTAQYSPKKRFKGFSQDEKKTLSLQEIRSRLIEIKERVGSEKKSLDSLISSLLDHQRSAKFIEKEFQDLKQGITDREYLIEIQKKHFEKLEEKSKEQHQLIVEATKAKIDAFKTTVQIEKNALLRAEKNLHEASLKERIQILFSPSIRREILLRNHPLKAKNCTREELALTIIHAAKKHPTYLIFRSKWEKFKYKFRTKIKRACLYLRSFYFRFCNWVKKLSKTLKKALFWKRIQDKN